MDDSSSGRQPLHLVGLDHAAFIAIVDCAIKNERHRFESRVRVRPAHLAVANVEMGVPQHDERIVKGGNLQATRPALSGAQDQQIRAQVEER